MKSLRIGCVHRARCVRLTACLLGLLTLVALAGCGGGDGSSSLSAATTVSLVPAAVGLPTGATQTFAAIVSGTTDQTVTWTVAEGSAGGTVTSAGVYTAPTAAGTYHVVATSSANVTISSVAAVTVTVPSQSAGISVAPSSITLPAGFGETFAATVTGAADPTVAWTVAEGTTGGTITSAGTYTAPTVPGTYHVVATSTADSTKAATAIVTVQ